MNKKGFISTALVYSFFLVFLMLLLFIVYGFTNNRVLLNKVKSSVKSELSVVSKNNATARINSQYHNTCNDYTLACQIAKKYTTDGENNLYYHDGKGDYAEEETEDYSYRYSGSSESVNNYICFGSTGDTYEDDNGSLSKFCSDENMYRIIGIFKNDDGRYSAKLISANFATSDMLGDSEVSSDFEKNVKLDFSDSPYRGLKDYSAGLYYWNYANSGNTYSVTSKFNVWNYSFLNTKHLNGYFLNKFDSIWGNKIEDHTWIVGGNIPKYLRDKAKTAYTYEILKPGNDITPNIYKGKVALMYISDYYYAASPEYWTLQGTKYSDAVNSNWLYLGGSSEWLLPRYANDESRAFAIYEDGDTYHPQVNSASDIDFRNSAFVRPVFYLNPDVTLSSGDGTYAIPYYINLD